MRYIGLILIVILVTIGCTPREDEAVKSIESEKTIEAVQKVETGTELSEEVAADDKSGMAVSTAESGDSDGKESSEELSDISELIEEVEEVSKAELTLSEMTLEEKVAQMFYVDLDTYNALDGPPVCGIIYFSHNMAAPEVLYQEIQTIKDNTTIPMFFGIDEEGGIVTRITEAVTGGTEVPGAWELANEGGFMSVYKANRVIATELRALGFNMNFAPVADIRTNPDNPVIGKRAFGDTADLVSSSIRQAMMAYDGQKIIPVIKHFPGHGDTKGDSHIETVFVDHDIERLMSTELLPFQTGIDDGIKMVMVGHIQVPGVTGDETPATLSKVMITDVLRGKMGFEGLVISDALNMRGITDVYTDEEVVEMALEAGLNIFLMPEDYTKSYDHLVKMASEDEEILEMIETSVLKILELKFSNELVLDEMEPISLEVVGSQENKDVVNGLIK